MVIYVFLGSVEVVKGYIEWGFYLGIGGIIIYECVKKIWEILGYLLEYYFDNILFEIDLLDMFMCGW